MNEITASTQKFMLDNGSSGCDDIEMNLLMLDKVIDDVTTMLQLERSAGNSRNRTRNESTPVSGHKHTFDESSVFDNEPIECKLILAKGHQRLESFKYFMPT